MTKLIRKQGRSQQCCEPKGAGEEGGQGFVSEPHHTISRPYIWGQGFDLKLSPGEFYIALTSDLLIPPTSPQALSYSSNMSFAVLVSTEFRGKTSS